jgi:hypothetical protein
LIKTYIGAGFLDFYKGRLYDILVDLYPPRDYSNKDADDYWIPWQVGQVEKEEGKRKGCSSTPKYFFTEKENRIWLVKWVMKQHQLTFPEHLNQLTQKHFSNNCGKGMLVKYYNTSVYTCLTDLFPEYIEKYLEPYMMLNKPKGFFDNHDNKLKAMKWVREQNGWLTPDNFYCLSREDFDELNLGCLIYYKNHKSFAESIMSLNPDLEFDISKFNIHKTEQIVHKFLLSKGYIVHKQFPIFNSEYGGIFRMDFYIPELNLLLEIDGDQHFRGKLECFQKIGISRMLNRDIFKMQIAKEKNYSISVSVVDSEGNVVAQARSDTAILITLSGAYKKAFTANSQASKT